MSMKRMRFLSTTLAVLLVLTGTLVAQDDQGEVVSPSTKVKMPLRGGLSPHGKYQIWVVGKDPMSYGYAFGFYKGEAQEPEFLAQAGGGFCVLQGASDIDGALWNEDSTMVAVQDHGTRHSMEIYLFLIKAGKAVEIPQPKFGDAVSKAMANIHGGAATAWILRPLKWDGSKFTLRLFGGPNWSDVTLRIVKSPTPHAILVSETVPVPIAPGDY